MIKNFLGGNAVFSFFDFPWFPIYIALLFAFDMVYGLYGLAATALLILITWVNEKKTKEGLEESNAEYRNAINFFDNNIVKLSYSSYFWNSDSYSYISSIFLAKHMKILKL